MGKKSIRENKNIYQLSREAMEYTRDKASETMVYVSPDRIEKIESEKSLPHPDEILAMAECYHAPELCNYFCSHECPIGQKKVPQVEMKNLSQIVLEVLASLNTLDQQKNRLVEITVDGEITEDEKTDFMKIRNELKEIAMSVEAMQMWVEKTIMEGKLDGDCL
jgi:hypothetical protein